MILRSFLTWIDPEITLNSDLKLTLIQYLSYNDYFSHVNIHVFLINTKDDLALDNNYLVFYLQKKLRISLILGNFMKFLHDFTVGIDLT